MVSRNEYLLSVWISEITMNLYIRFRWSKMLFQGNWNDFMNIEQLWLQIKCRPHSLPLVWSHFVIELEPRMLQSNFCKIGIFCAGTLTASLVARVMRWSPGIRRGTTISSVAPRRVVGPKPLSGWVKSEWLIITDLLPGTELSLRVFTLACAPSFWCCTPSPWCMDLHWHRGFMKFECYFKRWWQSNCCRWISLLVMKIVTLRCPIVKTPSCRRPLPVIILHFVAIWYVSTCLTIKTLKWWVVRELHVR